MLLRLSPSGLAIEAQGSRSLSTTLPELEAVRLGHTRQPEGHQRLRSCRFVSQLSTLS